jgi:hypothetical protein
LNPFANSDFPRTVSERRGGFSADVRGCLAAAIYITATQQKLVAFFFPPDRRRDDMDRIAELKQLISDELIIEVSEAFKDHAGFRRAFFSDPKGAYRRRFGKELLPGEEIAIEEGVDGTRYLCLPRINARVVVDAPASELSDLELAYTVGGAQQQAQQTQPVQGKSGFEKFCGSLFGNDKGASDTGGTAANQA